MWVSASRVFMDFSSYATAALPIVPLPWRREGV
jgi:hypothetical protein